MRMRHGVLGGVAVAALAIGLGACAPTEEADDGERSLTIGAYMVDYNPDPLNIGNLSQFPSQAMYDSLLYWDEETNSPQPWLATEFTLSEDRKTLALTLRDGVEFIDGEKLDAAAIETLFGVLLDDTPRDDGKFGYLWQATMGGQFGTEVVATGDLTVEFRTTQPITQFFFGMIQSTPIASPAAILDPDGFADGPVGTGPYLVDEYIPEVSVSFVRNPDYWNPDAYDFDTLEVVGFTDNIAAVNALKSGQIDATKIDIPFAADVEAAGFKLGRGYGQFGTLIILDHAGAMVPALGDVRVRQAMNLAFDRESIVETVDLGYAAVSSQPFTKGQEGYLEDGDDWYGYDLERARELMAEAGYEDGFDLTIPIISTGTGSQYTDAYEPIVQQALSDIGIRVTLEPVPDEGTLWTEMMAGTYPVVLMKLYYGATFVYLHEGTVPSFAPQILDPTLEDLVKDVDDAVGDELVEQSRILTRYLLEQAIFVPFAKPATLVASTPEIDYYVGGISGGTLLHQIHTAE